eukprot:2590860-Amphidinium_carterae.1
MRIDASSTGSAPPCRSQEELARRGSRGGAGQANEAGREREGAVADSSCSASSWDGEATSRPGHLRKDAHQIRVALGGVPAQ